MKPNMMEIASYGNGCSVYWLGSNHKEKVYMFNADVILVFS
jgi:hypothetical protein